MSKMKIYKWYFALLGVVLYTSVQSQIAPFQLVLEPLEIPGLGGLQSYAFGQSGGRWLILGGRLDGLHRRQPFASFDLVGNNTKIWVVDPEQMKSWSADISSLPSEIREPLSASNMEFYQEGDFLYCLGGYGYSTVLGDHTTYDKMTILNVPEIIKAVMLARNMRPFIRQIQDPLFQVTGGRLRKIEDAFYLLGGQKFIGRYNPMGPNHGPGFVQEYTNSIRIFSLADDGVQINVQHLKSHTDSMLLHRRDYNAESQILPNGKEGISLFSGVFQPGMDVPFLNCVTVDQNGYQAEPGFQQYYNHYHCPSMSLYSELKNEMHTVFFGGIAQYHDSAGILIADPNVPFVKTIARVTRNAKGEMAEFKLPVEMPALLGAGSEFIPVEILPHFKNGVLDLDKISGGRVLAGYIYGGIRSSAENIFFTNTGNESEASNYIYKVFLSKETTSTHDVLNAQSKGNLRVLIFPNPAEENFTIQFQLPKKSDVRITVSDLSGNSIYEKKMMRLEPGMHSCIPELQNIMHMSAVYVSVETPIEKSVQMVLLNK